MPNELSLLEEEALKYHLAGQSAVMESAKQQQVKLAPLGTPEGRYQRGLIDENEEATDDGRLFVDLMDAGIFGEDGNLTEKGQAFALPPGEALMERNLPAYMIRDKAGLNDAPPTSFGEDVAAVGGFVWDAVKSTSRMWNQATRLGPLTDWALSDEDEAEAVITRQGYAEGSIEGSAALGAGGAAMFEKGWAKLNDDERGYYWAKQKHERFKSDVEDINAGEIYGGLIDSQRAVEALNASRDAAMQRLGPERAKQLEKEAEAGGQLVGDPANIATAGAGFLVGSAGKLPMIARIGAKAEQATMAALRAEELAMQVARAKMAFDKTSRGAAVAASGAERSLVLGKGLQGQAYQATAQRLGATAQGLKATIPALEQAAADAATHSTKLAETAGGAQKVMAALEQAKEIGRQVRSAPARALGPVLESIGEGVMKADTWVSAHMKTLAKAKELAIPAGFITGSPLAALPAILSAGPVIKGIGNFTRVLGDELMQARGTVPFFRRVAENSATTPIGRATAHLFDTATLGGKLPAAGGRVARGVAGAAPVSLLFETINSGGEVDGGTVQRSLAGSLVFGGGGALAGALTRGRVNDLRARAAGDELNFRRTLAPDESRQFAMLDAGSRKMISVFAGSNPALKFKLTEDGPSSFNRATNTLTANTKARDFLRTIVAHEVNHYMQVKAQAEDGIRAMLVGDQGGLLRSKTGALDPNFKAFMDAYNERARKGGLPEVDVNEAAIEYFNEATVDSLMADNASGKLQARAGRSAGERMMVALVDAVVAKMPILQDMAYRVGGAKDAAGRMVQGNGLLSGGVRELPGAKAMIRKMMRDTAGRKAPSAAATSVTPAPLKVPVDSVSAEGMISAFETDRTGNIIKGPDGKPEVLKKETEISRGKVGKDAAKVIDAEEQSALEGKATPVKADLSDPRAAEAVASETADQKARRVKKQADGTYEGTHLSPNALFAVHESGKLNLPQEMNLATLNRAARDLSGDSYTVMVHPATKRAKGSNSPSYGTVEASLRNVVPIGMKINKVGGINVVLLELNQLVTNIKERAESPSGKALYDGNEMTIRQDVEVVLEHYRDNNKPTDAYFKAKYGPAWQRHKNFINSVLDTGTNIQKGLNTAFAEDSLALGKVIKTYRIDRISTVVRTDGGVSVPLGPNTYENAKINYLPEGLPGDMSASMPANIPDDFRQRAMQSETGMADLRPVVGGFSRDIGIDGGGWNAKAGMSNNASRAIDEGKLMAEDFREWAGRKLGGAPLPPAALTAGNRSAGNLFREYHHVGRSRTETEFYNPEKIERSPRFWMGVADYFADAGNPNKSKAAIKVAQEAMEAFEKGEPEPIRVQRPVETVDVAALEKSIAKRRDQISKWEKNISEGAKPPYDGYLDSQRKALAEEEAKLRQ